MNARTDDSPVLRLPVEGTWRLLRSPGHSRYAFDLVAVDETLRRTMTRSRFQHALGRAGVEDAFSWGEPVLSPIGGTVVRAAGDVPDRETLSLLRDLWSLIFSRPELDQDDISPMAGNHVIIQAEEGFYVFLAHMREGSVRVEEGEEVEAGEVIGRVGNSGSSLEPHLHLQLFDQIEDLLSATAPRFVIDGYEQWTGSSWEPIRGGELSKGDVVRAPRDS